MKYENAKIYCKLERVQLNAVLTRDLLSTPSLPHIPSQVSRALETDKIKKDMY